MENDYIFELLNEAELFRKREIRKNREEEWGL